VGIRFLTAWHRSVGAVTTPLLHVYDRVAGMAVLTCGVKSHCQCQQKEREARVAEGAHGDRVSEAC
jgi:hypothetical protein